MRRRVALFTLALLAGCAESGTIHGSSPATAPHAAQAPSAVTPLVDHHQHLLSPAGAQLTSTRIEPEIALPEASTRLLREREKRWSDQASLAELFVDDAFVFSSTDTGWIRGPKAAAAYLIDRFDGPYHLRPVAYRSDGPTRHVVGYMTEAEGPGAGDDFGYFELELLEGRDGALRIAAETHVFPGPFVKKPATAAQLVEALDAAGIRRAVVLSDAYYFDSRHFQPQPDKYAKVRAENDWTAREVAQFPERLVGFFSFNPLEDYALAELERCASSKRFQGLKLHFNGAGLNFQDPTQVAKVRRVMEAANARRLPVIIHVRSGNAYGRDEAEIFLHQIVAAAPDVPVTVAHLWGGENYAEAALAFYADAVSSGDPATRKLYFDVAEAWIGRKSQEEREAIVRRMRQIGMQRILYGSDAGKGPPREAWEAFGKALPLTAEEIRFIASNVAPYLRD